MRFFGLFFFLIIAILCSCIYTPDENTWKEIEQINTAEFFLNLNDFTDTIPYTRVSPIAYEFDIGSREFYLIEVQIGEYVFELKNISGIINKDLSYLEDGFHPMKIDIYTNSGTNSLADKSGNEVLYASFEYTLQISLGPPIALSITAFENDDGLLKISWEKFKNIGFYRYDLYRKGYQDHLVSRIDKISQNYCYDSSFVGGTGNYYVLARTTNGQGAKGPISTIEDEMPTITDFELQNPNDMLNKPYYKINWTKCNYYRAFNMYLLSANGCNVPSRTLIYNIDSTSLYTNVPNFGYPILLKLTTLPHNRDYLEEFSTIAITHLELGEQSDYSWDIRDTYYQPTTNTIYRVYRDSIDEIGIKILAYKNDQEIASRNLPGNTGLAVNDQNVMIATQKDIQYLDPVSLNTIETYSLSALGIAESYVLDMKSTNDRIHLLSVGNNRRDVSKYHLVDLNNNNIIESYNKTDTIYQFELSKDAKHLMINNHLYTIIDGNLALIGSIPHAWSEKVLSFYGTNTLVSIHNHIIRQINCTDLTVISEYPIDKQITRYKPFPDQGKIIFNSSCRFYIYSITDNDIEYNISYNNPYYFETNFHLTDEYIYSNAGFKFRYKD